MSELKLCYISGNCAYFTTQSLDKQWGDDWNDAPYEHNAGHPYSPHPNSPEDWNEDMTPKWKIIKVYFDGAVDKPEEGHCNSPYSVEKINKHEAPWLQTSRYAEPPYINLFAGASFSEFEDFIKSNEGKVYVSKEDELT
jgi:hypothetical protein